MAIPMMDGGTTAARFDILFGTGFRRQHPACPTFCMVQLDLLACASLPDSFLYVCWLLVICREEKN